MDELVTKFQKCIDVYKTIKDLELKKAYAIDVICYYEFFLKEHKAFGLFNMSFIDDLVKNLRNDSFFLIFQILFIIIFQKLVTYFLKMNICL